jgi:hydroxymethylpyrimidine/phosphomethylpyrimidine kinase
VKRLLVIAGSDSSAGAGIQADLKTAQAHGVYAQTAITAVTVQDTNRVYSVNPVSPAIVRAQIDAALNDIGADAIKIGMLGNAAIAAAVADALQGTDIPLVLDTVILSSSGAPLLDDEGLVILKTRLIPRAALVTPNFPECEALTGMLPGSEHRLRNAAMVFKLLGAEQVLLKGAASATCCGATRNSPTSTPRARTPATPTAPAAPWPLPSPAVWRRAAAWSTAWAAPTPMCRTPSALRLAWAVVQDR